jgi:phage shock protein E
MSPRTIIVLFLAAAAAVASTACKSDASAQKQVPYGKPADVDTAAAKQLIAGGATVIDVRTSDEFTDGHLPSARNVPVDEIGARLAEIEAAAGAKDKPIVVYCGTGARSSRARQALEAAGFTNVVNGGGYRALRTP